MPHDVAPELLRVEVVRHRDQVMQRLRRPVEAEHDADVAELDVEVDQQRPQPVSASPHARLTAIVVLPVPPFVDETMITRDALAWPPGRSRAALRSENAIMSAGCGRIRMSLSDGLEASSTRPSALAADEREHDRRARLLAQRGDLVRDRRVDRRRRGATTSTLSTGVRLSAALR